MEKPPFQFGLKAVFAVMTGAAVFFAIGEMGWFILAVTVTGIICGLFLLGVSTAALVLVELVIRDMIRLARWTWNRFRLGS